MHIPGTESYNLLRSLPSQKDVDWTKRLYLLPTITFSTIYDFLVDRKMLLRKVSYIENALDSREDAPIGKNNPQASDTLPNVMDNPTVKVDGESWYESVEYTRSLDKAYRFFKDGHVQDIKYHPWDNQPDVVCVTTTVLPSMRKDRIYHVTLIIRESSARVITAYCTCPAGLSGCCNHVTASLYCLEDYVHMGLREEELKGCTEKLQRWNQPKKQHMEPRPTDEVSPFKAEYGKEKHRKRQHVNKWDCRPDSRRIVDPNRARKLRESLVIIEKKRMDEAEFDMCTATTEKTRKVAHEKKCMLSSYGTSCFLQILDEEPAPSENRQEELRKLRIERAKKKQQLYKQQLSYKQTCVQHDHGYSCLSSDVPPTKQQQQQQQPESEYKIHTLVDDLYSNHVKIDPSTIKELEALTREQSKSEKWLCERQLRITASVMKEVCHHRASTKCEAFIRKKLSTTPINVPAINYGKSNEHAAITGYVNHQRSNGKIIQIESCGIFVHHKNCWLAGSPDAIVYDSTEVNHQKGCLEVKCPYVCEKRSIKDSCKEVSGFCLMEKEDILQLSKSHAYFYQVQTQMYVTGFHWCDFFIWSSTGEPFLQRINYDAVFMGKALLTAKAFYFHKFLPAVAQYFIVQPSCFGNTTGIGSNTTGDGSNTTGIGSNTTGDGSNTTGDGSNTTSKGNNTTGDGSNTTGIGSNTTGDGSNTTGDGSNTTSKGNNTTGDGSNTTSKGNNITGEGSNTTGDGSISHGTDLEKVADSEDLELVAVFSKPSTCLQSLQILLDHLMLKRHSVNGDGSCLYHAVAHQAGLITASSTGDEVVSRHLRLVFHR